MRVALYCASEGMRSIADAAVASVRKHMPDVDVVHLTNQLFPRLKDTQYVLRSEGRGLTALGRDFEQAHWVEHPMVLVHCGVLFKQDVRHVFTDHPHADVIAPHILGPDYDYDGGVIFCRDPLFWQSLLAGYACRGDKEKDLEDQLVTINNALCMYPGRVESVPGDVYSYVPRDEYDKCTGAAIVYYRGARMFWMDK